MAWDTKTIEGMENTCREEAEGDCNKKVNGLWLQVILYAATSDQDKYFAYLYNDKRISREKAVELLK